MQVSENFTVIYLHPNGAIETHNTMQGDRRHTIQIGDRILSINEVRTPYGTHHLLKIPRISLSMTVIKMFARIEVADPRSQDADNVPWVARKT